MVAAGASLTIGTVRSLNVIASYLFVGASFLETTTVNSGLIVLPPERGDSISIWVVALFLVEDIPPNQRKRRE